DQNVPEVNLRPLGLPADLAFLQLAFARGDLRAVDFARDFAILADNLGRVPLTDRLASFLQGFAIERVFALGAADGEDHAVVAVHALHLDAFRPDLVLALDVHQAAAVAQKLLLIFQAVGPGVFPVIAEIVVFVALFRVEIAVRLAGAKDNALLDGKSLFRIGVALEDDLKAGEILAVEEPGKAFLVLFFFAPGRDKDKDAEGQHGQRQPSS